MVALSVTSTNAGYDGSVDEKQFSGMLPRGGAATYGVDQTGDFRVTAVAGQDRVVSVAPGTAWGHSVVTVSDANVTVALDSVVSGSRWDMIVLRRDWQPQSGTTTVEVIKGGSTSVALPSRNTNAGVLDDQPLALVRVDAGSTTIGSIIDLRCWARNGGVTANSELVLQYLTALGTVVEINNVIYRVKAGGTYVENRLDEWDQPFRSMVMKAGMSIPRDAYTTIWNMQAGSGDTGDGLTFSGGVGTVNRAGLYEAHGQVTFPGELGGMRAASLTVNNKLNRGFAQAEPGDSSITANVSWAGRLNVGDTVSLQGWQNAENWMAITGTSDMTRWFIRRIGR